MTDECIVIEKKIKLDKKNKKTVDPVALLTCHLADQALSENVYDGEIDVDGEALQKAMILLSQHYQKKFQPRSGSNNLRFTSGSQNVQVPEAKKPVACFNCGKPGHIAKECRVKKVRDSAYYRKKLELAEKRDNGTALLAEEEFWLDHSNDEADTVETANMCFIGDDQSDDDDTDEDEQVLEIENEKRMNNKKDEISFVYTSENAKYFPDKSKKGRKSLNDISSIKSSMSDDYVDIYATKSDKKNISPIFYDSKRYTPPLVLEGKIIDLEDKMEDQNIQREIESDVILSFMTSSLEEKLISQKQDSVSGLSSDFKENKKEVLKSENFTQNFSDSEVSSDLLSHQLGLLDRTLSTPTKQIWRVKRTSAESTTGEDRYVDKIYKSDSFATCNKISKYSIKKMIRISKDVSYSSSDSSSDDYAFSSTDSYVYYSDNISRAFNVKSNKYFPTRTATNFHGSKYKWVPKSKIDSKLQTSNVKGE
ncbi:hypothetical protein L6452_34301 [Arctium lappa]|uniref:Uncharacterized protein n=1 Tax=Arctium lappa TaxID=4217 RepID=A0ACB8YIU8_ARCLA|nr:hypothetical protein L6452_34301 [Arctium lappa]